MATTTITGSLQGPVTLSAADTDPDALVVTSTGVVSGDVTLENQGAWTVRIDGFIQGALVLQAAPPIPSPPESTITIGRSGAVKGLILESGARVTNSGLITGVNIGIGFGEVGILLSGAAAHVITNKGTITGSGSSIQDKDGLSDDTVTNFGTLYGSVFLSGGQDVVTNKGQIFGDIFLGEGKDTLTSSGRIFGSVSLGDSDDTFKVSGRGTVTGAISLGAGDDQFFGGAGSETVEGGIGVDRITLGRGNDTYLATVGDGADTINGGSGSDTFIYTGSNDLIVNLDKIAYGANLEHLPQTAQESGGSVDTILGFENATGGGGNDLLHGSNAANVLNGGGGDDGLLGLGGNDNLSGGDGKDDLLGGLGRDTLHGGAGADRFGFYIFTFQETGKTLTTCDVIQDFNRSDGDKIALAHNNNLTFIGTDEFSNNGVSQLRFEAINSNQDTLIEGDRNGDGQADFAILLKGSFTLTAADFLGVV